MDHGARARRAFGERSGRLTEAAPADQSSQPSEPELTLLVLVKQVAWAIAGLAGGSIIYQGHVFDILPQKDTHGPSVRLPAPFPIRLAEAALHGSCRPLLTPSTCQDTAKSLRSRAKDWAKNARLYKTILGSPNWARETTPPPAVVRTTKRRPKVSRTHGRRPVVSILKIIRHLSRPISLLNTTRNIFAAMLQTSNHTVRLPRR